MELSARITPPPGDRASEVRLSHLSAGKTERIELGVLPDGPLDERAAAELRAGAAFLLDSALGVLAPEALARMIGCFLFACASARGQRAVRVRLRQGDGLSTEITLVRPAFEIEHNSFGVAHVLYEEDVLGLYVLEMAPGTAIPAHFHRLMLESELVLDEGLLLQGRPVRAGDAFHWSAGFVHEYRNPTDTPKRILCVDRPKFIPADEVVVPGPVDLRPMDPVRNYLT